MSKLKQKYIILTIILLLVIISIFFRRTTTSIKGLSLDSSGNFVKIDLGRYNENEVYNKYPAYIISNNSDFNILMIFGMEVKYPSNLTMVGFVENKIITFNDKTLKIGLSIQNLKNEGKKTPKQFFEELKESENNYDNLDVHYEFDGNKIIMSGKSKDKSSSFLNLFEVDNDSIKHLFLDDRNNTKNIDTIIDTMKNSWKRKL